MSENLNKLYTIIQINGELEKSKPNDLKLSERELYVDKESNLYYGNVSGEPIQINANKANESTISLNLGKEQLPFKINNDKSNPSADLNGLVFSDKQIDGSRVDSMKNFSLNDSTFTRGNISDLNSMTLSDDMWGVELPKGTQPHGKVFFLVSQ